MPQTIPNLRRRPRTAARAAALIALAASPAWAGDPGLTRDPAAARAWLVAHSDIDLATVVLIGEGYAFAATPGADGVFSVREELSSPALASALGGRSATLSATLDCGRRQSSIGGVRVYPENGLQGAATAVKATAWMRGTPVDLVDLAGVLCDPAAPRPLAGLPGSEPAPAPASAAPAPDPPAPDPAASDPVAAAPPAEAPAAAAPATTPPGGHWVQLGAFASEALAEAQWAKGAGLGDAGHRVEPADRAGRRLYRLLAGPYATPALAARACAAAKAAGFACLVR